MDFEQYYNHLHDLSSQEPNSYCVVDDRGLYIRIDMLVSKHYGFDLKHIVENVIQKFGDDRIIYFDFYDGGNPQLSGFVSFLEYLQGQYNLTRERTVIKTYQRVHIPNAIVMYTPISHFLVHTYANLKSTSLLNSAFTKKFGCLLGRQDMYRLKLVRHMVENYSNDAVISCHATDRSLFYLENQSFRDLYTDELDWAKNNLPIRPQAFNTTQWGSVNYFDAIDSSVELYNQFFFDIVCETDCNAPDWFTEKTYKNLMLGRPFIIWSGAGALQELRNLGFKTFSDFIEEQYDNEYSNLTRFNKILALIDEQAKMPIELMRERHDQMKPIFEQAQIKTILRRKHYGIFSRNPCSFTSTTNRR